MGPVVGVAKASGEFHLYFTDANGALIHLFGNGDQWNRRAAVGEYLGGQVSSAPVVIVAAPHQNDIFTRHVDGGIFYKLWDGNGWLPRTPGWISLDAVVG